jgi:tRNA pseudouridine13 synthase
MALILFHKKFFSIKIKKPVKIRRLIEDFIVHEHIKNFPITKDGEYTVLKVTKTDLTTRDMIRFLSRRLGISIKEMGWAGQKDRHALTTQYITVKGETPQLIVEKKFRCEKAGKSQRHITPADLSFNRFEITLRDLKKEEAEGIPSAIEKIKKIGVPNYYDTQRFWSSLSGEFFAESLLKGDFKSAFRLYFLSSLKPDKELLKTLKSREIKIEDIERKVEGNARKVLRVFKETNSYLKAIRTIDREELTFLVNVYQSFLFNEILSRFIKRNIRDYVEIRYSMGFLPFHRERFPEWVNPDKKIPVPGRKPFFDDEKFKEIYEEIKRERGIKDSFFNRREIYFVKFKTFKRNILLFPSDISIGKTEEDVMYPGRFARKISFSLPPGSYATIFIKSIIANLQK